MLLLRFPTVLASCLAGPLLAAAACLSAGCATPPPAAPIRIEPSPLTRFEGEVQLPNGATLPYAALLVPDPERAGAYLGTIDIPRQALAGASLSRVQFTPGEHVEFELAASGTPRWVGHYNADATIECRFHQAQDSLPCTLREVTARVPRPPAPALTAQTPRPPFPYRVTHVKVDNREAHVILAGTLSVPATPGAHAAVLLVGDGDVRDRDGTRDQHKPYLVLADHLTRAGIAVLRLDDRGIGESAGGTPEPSAEDLQSDVRAALASLRSRSQVDVRRVGLLAHGTGAPIAASVAAADPSVAFLVLLAPPAEPGPYGSVRCPVLALGAERDSEVDTARSVPALRSTLAHSRLALVDTMPGVDHQFRPLAEAAAGETFSTAALERISSWLADTLRR